MGIVVNAHPPIETLPEAEEPDRLWLRRYTKLVSISVLFLIFAGALVTSNDAGLAVPDWPLTYGENPFLYPYSKWEGLIFFEHGHRLVASAVGMLTLIMAIWVGRVESRRWVRLLAYCALGAVIAQGLLGGLTVMFRLPTAISVSHAVLAQTFFLMTIVIAYSQSKELRDHQRMLQLHEKFQLFRVSALTLGLIYLQLIVGALMRHTASGLAIPDFPTMGGQWWPVFDQTLVNHINAILDGLGRNNVNLTQVGIHFAHRVGAVVVTLAAIATVFTAFHRMGRDRRFTSLATFIGHMVLIQACLGIATVLSVRSPIVTSLHVATGALLLGATALLVIRSYVSKV